MASLIEHATAKANAAAAAAAAATTTAAEAHKVYYEQMAIIEAELKKMPRPLVFGSDKRLTDIMNNVQETKKANVMKAMKAKNKKAMKANVMKANDKVNSASFKKKKKQ